METFHARIQLLPQANIALCFCMLNAGISRVFPDEVRYSSDLRESLIM